MSIELKDLDDDKLISLQDSIIYYFERLSKDITGEDNTKIMSKLYELLEIERELGLRSDR